MKKQKKIDLTRVKTIKVSQRNTKADISAFGMPSGPDITLRDFLKTLPKFLKADDLLTLAERIARAKLEGRSLIWMMGAHSIKVGLSPVINDLIREGFITHLALNGACAIHDVEIAFFGRTSEEVSETLTDGSFGMVEETPNLVFLAAKNALDNDIGLGEGLGAFICEKNPDYADYSIFRECQTNDVPATVHLAIGTDTFCQHPGFDGSVFGKLSHDDFKILCESVGHLTGGVVLNIGSAVILPEVFLKALTVARNVYGTVDNFTAANFDMIQHYRPNINVVTRPVAKNGTGMSFTGHHEIMLPLLAVAIKIKYSELS